MAMTKHEIEHAANLAAADKKVMIEDRKESRKRMLQKKIIDTGGCVAAFEHCECSECIMYRKVFDIIWAGVEDQKVKEMFLKGGLSEEEATKWIDEFEKNGLIEKQEIEIEV